MHVRHTSVATDSIIARWRCTAKGRDYMLGDEFKTSQSLKFRLKMRGAINKPDGELVRLLPMWATFFRVGLSVIIFLFG